MYVNMHVRVYFVCLCACMDVWNDIQFENN